MTPPSDLLSTLRAAVNGAAQSAFVIGTSDELVEHTVTAGLAPDAQKVATPVADLHRDIEVRPVDIMLNLARALKPISNGSLAHIASYWSFIKYIDAFDVTPGQKPTLRLSQSASSATLNQRRVISEELGMAFGVAVAELWCGTLSPGATFRAIDIDHILADIAAPPYARQIRQRGSRPDFLLESTAPEGAMTYRLLETKGSVNRHYALTSQLRQAMGQLTSLEIDGGIPQGLAVATVATADSIECIALDPADHEIRFEKRDFMPEEQREPLVIIPPRKPDAKREMIAVPLADLAKKATAASYSSLAQFAGMDEVADRWLPDKRGPLVKTTRSRTFETEIGDIVGFTLSVEVPGTGHVLTVLQGTTRKIAEALQSGSSKQVWSQQMDTVASVKNARPSAARGESESPLVFSSSEVSASATAVGDDGAILELIVTPQRDSKIA